MRKKILLIAALITALFFTACALPRPAYEAVDFVSLKDRETVSLTRQGLDYIVRGRNIDGELKLRQALFLEPAARPIRYNLASVLVRQGLFAEAEELLIALRKEVPGSARYASLLASAYLQEDRFLESEIVLRESLWQAEQEEDMKRQVVTMKNLSTLAFRHGDEEDALCWSERAFALSPDEEQQVKHARLLLAAHYPRKALKLASETLQVTAPEAGDPGLGDTPQDAGQVAMEGEGVLAGDASFSDVEFDENMQDQGFVDEGLDPSLDSHEAGHARRFRRGPNRKLQLDIVKAQAYYELAQFSSAFRLSEKHLAHPIFSAQDQLALTVVNILALDRLPEEEREQEIQRLSELLEDETQKSTSFFADDEPMNELNMREQVFVKEMLGKSYIIYWPGSIIDDAERKIGYVEEEDVVKSK